MIWSILIMGLGIGYLLFFVVVMIGMMRLPSTNPVEDCPKVSVIVPCRNEEKDLARCVEGLLSQDYPKESMEIVLVDDQSLDNTEEVIRKYADEHQFIRHVNTKDAPGTHLKAKARAIAYGMSVASGEWYFIVDADTRVDTEWLRHMLWGISDKDALIGGLIMTEESGFFSVSALEKVSLAYTQPITVGMSGLGFPAICSGPNMAIRKDVYDSYGGLEKVDFDVAEDLALSRIVLDSGYQIKFHGSRETTGNLISVPTLKHLLSQQRRWVKGGFEHKSEFWLMMIFLFTYHFAYSILLIVGWFAFPFATLMLLLSKAIADFLLLLTLKLKLKVPRIIRFWPIMYAYSTLAFIWLPLSLLISRKIAWKGEGYEVKYDKG